MNPWDNDPIVSGSSDAPWANDPIVDAKANKFQDPPNLVERFGRGVADVGQGLKQLYLLATDKDEAAKYTALKNGEDALYEAGRAKGQATVDEQFGHIGTLRHLASLIAPGTDPQAMMALASGGGPDVARFGGNVAATAPTMFVPGAAAESLLVRMASQGAGGALASGAMFEPSGTVGGKIKQTAAGLGVGAFLPAAGDVAGRVAGAATDLARPIINKLTGKTSDAAAAAEVSQALNGAGIDFAALPVQVKASLTASAKDQLNVSGAIDVGSLLRKADIESVGGTATKGMLTREPEAWNFERETSKIRGPGDPLQDVFKANNDALREQLPAMQQGTGSTAASPYQAAESAREGVDAYSQGARRATSDLYKAAEDAPGNESLVDGKSFFDNIKPIVEALEDNISGPVKRRLAELEAGLAVKPARVVTKAGINTETDDIVTAVRKAGGINPADERIGSLAKGMPFGPHPAHGPVWRQPEFAQNGGTTAGHSVDGMAQRMYEKGYLERPDDLDGLYDKLADSFTGHAEHFSTFKQPPPADPLAAALEANTAALLKSKLPAEATPRDFTMGEAGKLYQLINDSMGGAPGKAGFAARKLNDALMDAAGNTAGDAGSAADLFRQATASARDRFTKLEPTPIKALADTGEASPTFLQNHVLGGKPGELAALKDMLSTSKPGAWADIQHQTLEHLAQKAMGGDVAEGLFSGARFSKALASIGDDRLAVIFSPQELAQLKQVERAAHAMTKEPPLANVNHSNTASTMANLIGKVGSIPVLGHIGALPLGFLKAGQDVVKEASLGRAAREAINPSARAFTPGADTSAVMREFLARALRGWGAAGAAANASPSGP